MGMIPLLLFSLLEQIILYRHALGISLLTAFLFVVISIVQMKQKIYNFMTFISLGVLSVFVAVLMLPEDPRIAYYTPLFLEIILFGIVVAIRHYEEPIHTFLENHIRPKQLVYVRNSIDELLVVIRLLYYTLLFRFGVLTLYSFLPALHTETLDTLMATRLGFLLGVGIVVFEQIRLKMLANELGNEFWMPIVDESGKVIGKIAESEKSEANRAMLHPAIRLVFEFEGRLYLSREEETKLYNWAVEELVPFGITPEESLRKILKTARHKGLSEPRLLMTHVDRSGETHKLVMLYAVHVKERELRLMLPEGKYWLPSQIRQNLQANIFSPSFAAEFDFVCNTVLYEVDRPLSVEASL